MSRQDYDFEENMKLEWNEYGCKYLLEWVYFEYAYRDEDGGHGGSGVKHMTLELEKGNHEFYQIDIDSLNKRNRDKLEKIAEEEACGVYQ